MTTWALFLLLSGCDPGPANEGKRLFDLGKFAEAEAHFRLAMEQRCGTAQQWADRVNLAATLRERNRLTEAAALLSETAGLTDQAAETQISYWNCRALIAEHAERLALAESEFERANTLLAHTASVRLHLQIATNQSRLYLRQGRLREAEAVLTRVRRLPGWERENLPAYALNLAELRRLQGRPKEAESILRPLLTAGDIVPAQVRGAIANNLANLAARRGAHREAEALWRVSNQALRDAYGPAHPLVARGLNNQAAYLVSRKQYERAQSLYREAIHMREDPLLLNNLAALLHQRGRLAEAEEIYNRAVRLYEQASRPSRDALQLYGNLALLELECKRPAEAAVYFQSVVRLLPLAVPADETMLVRYLEQYEKLLRSRKESAEAERVAMMAMRYRVKSALHAEN